MRAPIARGWGLRHMRTQRGGPPHDPEPTRIPPHHHPPPTLAGNGVPIKLGAARSFGTFSTSGMGAGGAGAVASEAAQAQTRTNLLKQLAKVREGGVRCGAVRWGCTGAAGQSWGARAGCTRRAGAVRVCLDRARPVVVCMRVFGGVRVGVCGGGATRQRGLPFT